MPSGGARVRSGPPPREGSIRQGRLLNRGGIVHLPAAGREGPPPAWPLPGRMTKWEVETWEAEWRRPQALMWERLGLELQVAIYVRSLRLAVSPGAAAARLKDLNPMANNLGLTADAMKRLGWVIDADPVPAAATAPRPADTSAKDRLRMIQGGAVAEGGANAAAS